MVEEIKQLSKKAYYYEDLYDIFWKLYEKNKLKPEHYKDISIGLFNTPCGGFGDIIVCKTFYDYLREWYPTAKISICTTAPQKYKDLGIDGNIYKLYSLDGNDENECIDYDNLVLKKKVKFDIMITIPIINKTFEINQFKKLINYANVFNTFSVSEYNGEYPPYTFPIGVGEGNLGLLFNNFKWKQQNIISKPYAMVYIQPSPEWGVHSKTCFLSFIEMICKKYSKQHSKFQVVIPSWINEEVFENDTFRRKIIKVIKKYYDSIYFIDEADCSGVQSRDLCTVDHADHCPIYGKKNSTSKITFRADILPQKRDIFISLMKDSVRDILVTGDQSLTDILSCCKKKRVWYQIAPWKKGLANNLSEHLPNKYYSTFKTSCGTLKSVNTDIEWRDFMKKYDFRVNGKKRMDSILIANYHTLMKGNPSILNKLLDIIEHSRFLDSAVKKINKL